MGGARRALLIIVGAWLVSLVLWITPGLFRPDGVGYFAYLPSTWFDRDLLFFNEWDSAGMIRGDRIYFKDPTVTDHLGNHWTVGTALAWYPAYAFGDLARSVIPLSPRDGFSLAYVVPVVVFSALAGLVSLIGGWSVARKRFGDRTATLAALAIWFGSPLVWYSLRHATTSHAMSAAACTAVVLLALRLRDGLTTERLVSVGLAVGFAAAVRPQNVLFALVPLLVLPWSEARSLVRRSGWLVVGAMIGILPQIVVSMTLWGSPLAFVNVGGAGNRWQMFERVRLWETIFSSYHGLAVWTPLLLLAIGGMVVLMRDDAPLARAALVSFIGQWLLVSLLDRSFWGGSAFGQRRFDNCTVFFLIGLAALLARLPRWASTTVVAAGSAWTMLLFAGAARVDLNAWQPIADVVRAGLADLAAGAWRTPIWYAPPALRGTTAVFAALAILFGAGLWLAIRHLVRRPATAATLASLYLLGMSALLMWSGRNGPAHLTARERALIAVHRSGAMPSGEVMNTINALEHEVDYLARNGHPDEAQRTQAEIEEMAGQQRALRRR